MTEPAPGLPPAPDRATLTGADGGVVTLSGPGPVAVGWSWEYSAEEVEDLNRDRGSARALRHIRTRLNDLAGDGT